eukprot:gene784-1052_t
MSATQNIELLKRHKANRDASESPSFLGGKELPTSKSWVENTFAVHIKSRKKPDGSLPKTLLFCDNLDSQVHEGFLSSLHEVDSSRYCLPPHETEMCQPIDGGIGAVIKVKIGQAQDEWLDVEGNLDAWEGDPNATYKLDASMRRILINNAMDGTDDTLIRPMRGLEYTANDAGDPEDENEERENVEILGEVVVTALDTEDANAVISLLLERPSANAEEQDENQQMDENPPAVDDDVQKHCRPL